MQTGNQQIVILHSQRQMNLLRALVKRHLSSRESDHHKRDDIMRRVNGSYAGEIGDRQGPEAVLHWCRTLL